MAVKYFAMIDGRCSRPMLLEELPEAGVRPDTYVWCKGMTDWRQAREVADICRMWRRRLAGEDIGAENRHDVPAKEDTQQIPAEDPRMLFRSLPLQETATSYPDTEPRSIFLEAILSILAFPPMGIRALYYQQMSRKCWKKAAKARLAEGHAADFAQWRDASYINHRKARVSILYSLAAALIFWPTVIRFI